MTCWEHILQYSKRYIPKTHRNISLTPIYLKDKNMLSKYGGQLILMYNDFRRWHKSIDVSYVKLVVSELDKLFVNIEDLLKFIITDINIEFSGIFLHDNLIGFISYRVRPKFCLYIQDIWMEPEFRNQGYFSDVHHILRQVATTMKCQYTDLAVLVGNKLSYNKYRHLGYSPYIASYIYPISGWDEQHNSLSNIFIIKLLNRHTMKELFKDFKELWLMYHEYKHLRFRILGLYSEKPTAWDINNIIHRRFNPLSTCQIFYHEDRAIGFITYVKSHSNGPCTLQVNELYFVEPFFADLKEQILSHIIRHLFDHEKQVKYFTIFAAKSDVFKIEMFEGVRMMHRSDNLFLPI